MPDLDNAGEFSLPADLVAKLAELSRSLGESSEDIVVAAVDHFTILPVERQKAVLKAAGMRRRR
jgi:hypothetical protein